MLLMRGIAQEAVFARDPRHRIRARQRGRWKMQGTMDLMERGGWMAPPRHEHPPVGAPQPAADPIAQLRDLAALRSDGVLSEDEFRAQKARLLAS
jgi:hypothetical protein